MENARNEPELVLVVDDDPRIRQMLSRYFEGEGYRVSLAGDGREMRNRLDKAPADIVLLDLGLPGEDGLSLARELRAHSDVPIIMLTGRDDVVDRVVGLAVRPLGLARPVAVPDVVERVVVVVEEVPSHHVVDEPVGVPGIHIGGAIPG